MKNNYTYNSSKCMGSHISRIFGGATNCLEPFGFISIIQLIVIIQFDITTLNWRCLLFH